MDREKAIQILKRCEAESHCEHYKRHYCCIGCGQRGALDLAIEALKQTEIVRCKDCGHRITTDWCKHDEGTARSVYDCDKGIINDNKDSDYCSYGERNEESITIQTGQTYDKSANYAKDIYAKDIVEQNEKRQVEKKILPEYYKEIRTHRKMFEIRKDEDNFQVGDIIVLREWDGEKYTGNKTRREITYILRNAEGYGLKEGYCILSLQVPGWDHFRPDVVVIKNMPPVEPERPTL